MATIASTRIGTSDDASLCKGFALFPGLGNPRAGVSVNASSNPLFDTGVSLLVLRFNAGASANVTAGLCGPGYGFNCLVEGKTEGSSLSLDFSDDAIEAGFFFGLSLGASLNLNVQRLGISWVWDGWHSGIRTTWEDLVNVSPSINIDLVGLLLELILYLLDESGQKDTPLHKVNNISPSLLGTYGMVSGGGGQLAESGVLYARPSFSLPVNFVSKVPLLAGVDKTLSAMGGGLALGVTIGVTIPVRARFAKVRLSNGGAIAEYPLGNLSNGHVETSTSGTPVENPTTLGMDVEHTPGFDLRFGLFLNVSVLKLFSMGTTISIDMLNLLGIDVDFGTFSNPVSNTIGQTSIGGRRGGVAKAADAGLMEVVLAPPGYVNA